MRRPPTGFAVAFVLGACLEARSPPRPSGGGSGNAGSPAAAPRPTGIERALFEPNDVIEAPLPEAHRVDEDTSEGNGSGFSREAGGLGPRRAMPPEVIPGSVTVHGSLDKEIIRRIVRRHIDEVKYCYERELVRKRTLRGQAIFELTISRNGEVTTARLRGSTLRTPRAESCLVAAIRTWRFPYDLAQDDTATRAADLTPDRAVEIGTADQPRG
ncbi:MAG TPA: AgmX/PglI C-terminal domain-containing protein [Polyangia bacterium]|jgi:hypothetical protein|nr:AgmX/PglI C-terminal domain-containing protein [Polyangia bacterium]